MPRAEAFRHLDAPDKVRGIRVIQAIDESPDLSYLEDENRYKGVPVKEAAKYREEDQKRIESYGRDWWMTGIWAEAQVVVDSVVQTIRSGGIWGIESDSHEGYPKEVALEEVSALKDILKKMGFKNVSAWDGEFSDEQGRKI